MFVESWKDSNLNAIKQVAADDPSLCIPKSFDEEHQKF